MQVLTRTFAWWKSQPVLLKLITGFSALVFACCVCSIPLSIIAPDRTPTAQPLAQEPIAQDKPTDSTPIPELTFGDIVQNPDEKKWTGTQYSTYFDTIKGQYISGWSGTILEIDEYGGEPYLSLDMEPGEPTVDVYAYLNKDDILKVGLGQRVTFAGTIDSNWSEGNGFYALQIKDVTLFEVSEALPTPTPIPADTPVPTNTSFGDIVQNPDEKKWTSTQYSTYFDTIKGQYVSGWSGTILEIDEYGGEPYLSLDMEPGEPKIDVYAYLNKDDLLKVGLRQRVTFAGTIDSNWSEGNGFYALQIKDVTLIELGEIPPTPTPAPTPTPVPTYTPTPDIGDEIGAEVMCQDFVRDNLKAPSTADFGGLLDDRDKAMFLKADKASGFGIDTANLRNSGVWVVVGQVDAENSFGAMILSEYTCIMDYDSDTQMWYLLDISIE